MVRVGRRALALLLLLGRLLGRRVRGLAVRRLVGRLEAREGLGALLRRRARRRGPVLARVVDLARLVEDEARRVALSVVEAMDFVGLLAVELFLDKQGRILVNEVAPRAHNSGHHTIEACGTSQFEQHLRAILGLPLGDTAQRSAAAMLNLIGAPGASGTPVYPALGAALSEPGLHPHIYGKVAVREGRKMGHVTVLADSADAAEQRVLALRDHISTVHAH